MISAWDFIGSPYLRFHGKPGHAGNFGSPRSQGAAGGRLFHLLLHGRETMTATGTAPMARWPKLLFIYMSRNAWNATSFFKLPPDRVIELGNHVEL